MDGLIEILNLFGGVYVIFAAFTTSVAVGLLKKFPLKKWADHEYFGLFIWAVTIILAYLITWMFQRLGLVFSGIENLVIAGIYVAGGAMLGWKGVTEFYQAWRGDNIGGDKIGGDKIDIDTISGGTSSIGRESQSHGGGG